MAPGAVLAGAATLPATDGAWATLTLDGVATPAAETGAVALAREEDGAVIAAAPAGAAAAALVTATGMVPAADGAFAAKASAGATTAVVAVGALAG